MMLPLASALLLALAQDTPAPTPVDHLQHPPGTVTGEPGLARIERRGTGPVPLVLIAGAPFGARAWEGFLTRNAERYTMFAVVPAGYEGTPPPPMPAAEQADYAEQAWTQALLADLVALIEQECVAKGLGPAVLIGHHLMGDYYAVRLSYEHPELVRGVISAAGQGSFPMRGATDPEARARYARTSRAPFFQTVPQSTWNANTFPARALSKDPERGQRLFDEQIGVPIATQVRYYLEYMTDELEPNLGFIEAPILSLEIPPSFTFDDLPQATKDQLVKQFGSLEEARKSVQMGGPWTTLKAKSEPGQIETLPIADSGLFLMDDAPAAFDQAVADFVAKLAPAAKSTEAGATK